MTALPSSGAFVMVDPVHVAAIGAPAALLFARICWRAERDGAWKASRDELARETGLSPDVIRTALRVLREGEWVAGVRASAADATLVWRPVLPGHADMGISPMACGDIPHLPDVGNSPISSTQTVETTTDHTADAVGENIPNNIPVKVTPEESPAMTVPESYQEPLLPAVGLTLVTEDPGPPKTAQTLVARWCDGYRVSNGHDAPGPLMKRVTGQMKNLAKSCGDDHDDWVAAYGAAYRCGTAGAADAVRFMSAPPARRARTTNAFASPELGGTPGAAAALAAFTAPRALQGPA